MFKLNEIFIGYYGHIYIGCDSQEIPPEIMCEKIALFHGNFSPGPSREGRDAGPGGCPGAPRNEPRTAKKGFKGNLKTED